MMMTMCYAFCVMVMCISVTSAAGGGPWPQAPRGCLHGGRVVSPGTRFRPDPCSRCRCPRKGGLVVCTAEDCRHDGNCLRHDNTTSSRLRGSCCPACAEYGCRHTDGHLYRPGEVISSDGCSRCYCPLSGGGTICDVTPCPPILCVDFVLQPGQCCPACPRGHNCQLGLGIIPRGRVVTSGGALCRCRLKRRGDNHKLEAVCLDPGDAKIAKLLSTLEGRQNKHIADIS